MKDEITCFRWEYNIKIGITETSCEGVDWIRVTLYRGQWWAFVNSVMSFGYHKG